MTTSITFPINRKPATKMILEPRPLFAAHPRLTIFKVLIRQDGNQMNREWMYCIKLGGNTFQCLKSGLRFRIRTGREHGAGTMAFREIGNNPSKKPLYIYEVYKCESIINIGKEEMCTLN